MNAEIPVTNLVRRTGKGHVITASGRPIPTPPWVIAGSPQTAVEYDQWLLEQARAEATETGEHWMLDRLAGVVTVDADLRFLLSDFLFGHPYPVFEARPGPDDAMGE